MSSRTSSDTSTGNYYTREELVAMNEEPLDDVKEFDENTQKRYREKLLEQSALGKLTPSQLRERAANEMGKRKRARYEKAADRVELLLNEGEEVKRKLLTESRIAGIRERGEGKGPVEANTAMRALDMIYSRKCMVFIPPTPTRWGIKKYIPNDRHDILETNPHRDFHFFATEGLEYIVDRSKLKIPDKDLDLYKFGDFTAVYNFKKNEGINIREDILEASKSSRKPLFFVVTSPHHAILCIIYNNTIYSVGYGYLGDRQEDKKKHFWEYMDGSIYSSDDSMPTREHDSSIAWVGFLTETICNNIDKYIRSATGIIYQGRVRANKFKISTNFKLKIPYDYREASGWFPTDNTFNCIEWVKHIIGENLNCGEGRPGKCDSVSQSEWDSLINSMGNNRQLYITVGNIQGRLKSRQTYFRKIMSIKYGNRQPIINSGDMDEPPSVKRMGYETGDLLTNLEGSYYTKKGVMRSLTQKRGQKRGGTRKIRKSKSHKRKSHRHK